MSSSNNTKADIQPQATEIAELFEKSSSEIVEKKWTIFAEKKQNWSNWKIVGDENRIFNATKKRLLWNKKTETLQSIKMWVGDFVFRAAWRNQVSVMNYFFKVVLFRKKMAKQISS